MVEMKKIITLLGLTGGLMLSITLFITFLSAYNSPIKETTITINTFGEANFELVLLIFFLPCIIYSFLSEIKHLTKEGENKIYRKPEDYIEN